MPSPLSTTTPPAALVVGTTLSVNVSPSTSVSLFKTANTALVSSSVDTKSTDANGALLDTIAVTVTLKVIDVDCVGLPSSVTVIVTEYTPSPLPPGVTVKVADPSLLSVSTIKAGMLFVLYARLSPPASVAFSEITIELFTSRLWSATASITGMVHARSLPSPS